MSKMNSRHKLFLNRHKKIKRIVYKYLQLTVAEQRKFIILPIIIILIFFCGIMVARPINYDSTPKISGIITDFVDIGWAHRSSTVAIEIDGEWYCKNIGGNKQYYEEMLQKLEELKEDKTKVTLAITHRPFVRVLHFPYSIGCHSMVDLRSETEVIFDIQNRNANLSVCGKFIYIFCAGMVLIYYFGVYIIRLFI